jgi:AraC family transcriptional regulator, glycine betaine-responsive activator
MLTLIADDHGKDLANAVADQLIYAAIRTDRDMQRLSIPTRIGVRHPRLSRVIERMEASDRGPGLARRSGQEVGMSTRQLERLFRRYLNRSPKRYYMELRLAKARNLLMQTDLSVINVALACGFVALAFFEMLPRAIRHHPLSRTRRAWAGGRGRRRTGRPRATLRATTECAPATCRSAARF